MVQGMYALVLSYGGLGYGLIAGMLGMVGALMGWAGVAFGKLKNQLFDELGIVKYAVTMALLLMMMGVLGKIALRLLFGIKYILSFPGVNLNI